MLEACTVAVSTEEMCLGSKDMVEEGFVETHF